MKIEWFTVAAQVVNFLILVWLLKRFLYKPILDAIDAREKRVAKDLADAAAKQAEAQAEREEFQKKNAEFAQQRAGLLDKAKEDADTERERLLDEARRDAEALRKKQQSELQRERNSLEEDLSRRTREEVFALARKTLADLAGATLEERMAEVFELRLRELDASAKQGLAQAFGAAPEKVVVRSAFDLAESRRSSLLSVLEELLGSGRDVAFETVPGLLAGIELMANGRKVCWSIADHLASLERTVDELLKESISPSPSVAEEVP